MKEHPILFNGEMVRAVLEGRKTQTRRVVKNAVGDAIVKNGIFYPLPTCERIRLVHWTGMQSLLKTCPYGQPGDWLWVRETWCSCGLTDREGLIYRATDGMDADDFDSGNRWCPSIHMPRWASRITLDVIGVRVERVQDITETDAKAEGVKWVQGSVTAQPYYEVWHGGKPGSAHCKCYCNVDARPVFRRLWDSINASRGYGWDANPFVWVVEFKVVERRGHG